MTPWLLWSIPASAQTLEVTGSCPSVVWSASGLTPGGTVVLMAAPPGRTPLAAGPCAGTSTRLGPLVRTHTLTADEVGGHLQATSLAGSSCSDAYQILDVATCRVSNVVRIPSDSGIPAGSLAVDSGPRWSSDTTPLSCLEACALRFGGHPEDYWCSTHPSVIDHLAFLDGWGDDRLCSEPQPEDFAAGTTTRCSGAGCYASAWVSDHGCKAVNYCFLR